MYITYTSQLQLLYQHLENTIINLWIYEYILWMIYEFLYTSVKIVNDFHLTITYQVNV